MFIQSGYFVRPAGKIVIRVLLSAYRTALEEADRFIQHPCVTGAQDIPARSQWQPEQVVRTVRTHTPAGRRMPPVLNISLLKLMGCRKQELLAHKERFCVNERHYVLQLVAKTKGTP